jgi:hypothetical protein
MDTIPQRRTTSITIPLMRSTALVYLNILYTCTKVSCNRSFGTWEVTILGRTELKLNIRYYLFFEVPVWQGPSRPQIGFIGWSCISEHSSLISCTITCMVDLNPSSRSRSTVCRTATPEVNIMIGSPWIIYLRFVGMILGSGFNEIVYSLTY